MSKTAGNARNGNARKQQQRGVCMPQSVDRDDRDVTGFAMPTENVVHRRIIDSGVDKDGLIFGKVLY